MPEKIVTTISGAQTAALFGTGDCHARFLEEKLGVTIRNTRPVGGEAGDALVITGEEPGLGEAAKVLEYLKRMTVGDTLDEQTVEYVVSMVSDGEGEELTDLGSDIVCITSRGKPIRPKTVGQRKYVEAVRKNTVVLGIGPAGTGKTFLAVAMAVEALRDKQVSRIILTRPAVEAGEKLGFLPGDLQNKIDPYLRPLYDALYEMMGSENFARHLERGTIEIAPLAYMRGRTLDDSFIILDEAQNTTSEQMKMFLTRLGYRSKAVVTGDPSQTDLPYGKKSGLAVAAKILGGIEGIAIHEFSRRDVVRHHLVQQIIKAYESYEKEQPRTGGTHYVRKSGEGKK
ncbi:MAG: PhoH family protein [Clostridia bacterium]|nr:PhoH family protein [Clostridia bacterium]MDY6184823.1 PhoH family protein [Eubacteriales bacterium]